MIDWRLKVGIFGGFVAMAFCGLSLILTASNASPILSLGAMIFGLVVCLFQWFCIAWFCIEEFFIKEK